MEKILFINACVRDEQSRTLRLADSFLKEYQKRNPEHILNRVDLAKESFHYLGKDSLEDREKAGDSKNFESSCFDAAKQFARADKIIIAAPFWDLSFPAVLKVYFENICISGLTFTYEGSKTVGLCKAQKLLYITTRGGDFSLEETLPLELGTPYIRGICRMLGIGEFLSLSADGLDIWGNDPQKILEDAKKKAVTIARCF